MKRVLTAVSIALLAFAFAVPAAMAARSTSAFTGEWIGRDPAPPDGDGSTVHLYVSGGDRPNIVFTDEYATVCVNSGARTPFFTSLLSGYVDGNVLWGRFNVAKCGPLTLTFLRGAISGWALDDQGNSDPSDDTLWDGSVLWTRVS
jgi:hypothetical protein